MTEYLKSTYWLLAQAAPAQGTTPATPATDPAGSWLLPIMMMLALFYFMILRPQQNKDKQFRSMLDGLNEKDRVVTIGGIHGVVSNVQRDRDEVTLRVDESTGAKIRVGSSAIARLLTDEDKKDKKT